MPGCSIARKRLLTHFFMTTFFSLLALPEAARCWCSPWAGRSERGSSGLLRFHLGEVSW